MKRAIITVGLGFGDEGKGATVDFLVRAFEADLVVRYCGGSQAGHNVERADGQRHTFSQFGAGGLTGGPGARTYLGPAVVIDPVAMQREADHLVELGVVDPLALVTVHPRCLVATAWHRAVNRLRERSRGSERHGSCGQGIGAARSYWLRHGEDAVFAADLADRDRLRHKMELLRQRSLLEIQEFVGRLPPEHLDTFDLWKLHAETLAWELAEVVEKGVAICPELPPAQTVIFEGAQGVLLDEYRGFHPHTTWSTVTAHHAWELVQQLDAEEVSLLGLTRSYTTRHGNGPLPTFTEELTTRLIDPGNLPNPWQGSLRCGWLDLPLLHYAATVAGPLDGLVVNHLDQIDPDRWLVCEGYENQTLLPARAPDLTWQEGLTGQLLAAKPVLTPNSRDQLLARLDRIAPVVLQGFGPRHDQRHLLGPRFRRRRRP